MKKPTKQEIQEEYEWQYFNTRKKIWRETFNKNYLKDFADYSDPNIKEILLTNIERLEKEIEEDENFIRKKIEIIENCNDKDTKYFCKKVIEMEFVKDLVKKENELNNLKRLLPTKESKMKKLSYEKYKEKIEEINKLPIENEIAKYLKLIPVGKRFKALCPFHSEKTPSFYIYPENNNFYCFGCNQGGNLIKFKMLLDNTDFKETVNNLINNN